MCARGLGRCPHLVVSFSCFIVALHQVMLSQALSTTPLPHQAPTPPALRLCCRAAASSRSAQDHHSRRTCFRFSPTLPHFSHTTLPHTSRPPLVLQSSCPLTTGPGPPQPSHFLLSQLCSHSSPTQPFPTLPALRLCCRAAAPARPPQDLHSQSALVPEPQHPPSSLPRTPPFPPSLAAVAELLPPRDRPKTTTAVALRFLSHALGMPNLRSKEAEAELAQQRQAAKANRRAREAARDEVWQ